MAGEMAIMTSGLPAAYVKCEPVLQVIAGKIYRLSDEVGPGSAVNTFIKDLRIILDYAKKSVFPLPLPAKAHQMYLQASAAGHGLEEDSAVIKNFPGIKLPEPK